MDFRTTCSISLLHNRFPYYSSGFLRVRSDAVILGAPCSGGFVGFGPMCSGWARPAVICLRFASPLCVLVRSAVVQEPRRATEKRVDPHAILTQIWSKNHDLTGLVHGQTDVGIFCENQVRLNSVDVQVHRFQTITSSTCSASS